MAYNARVRVTQKDSGLTRSDCWTRLARAAKPCARGVPSPCNFFTLLFRYFLCFEKLFLPASPLFAGYESSGEEVPDLARMPVGRVSADRVIKFAESHCYSRMVSSEFLRCATYAVLVEGKPDAIRAARAKWSENRDDVDNWDRKRLPGGRDSEQPRPGMDSGHGNTTQPETQGWTARLYLTPANSLKRRVRRAEKPGNFCINLGGRSNC